MTIDQIMSDLTAALSAEGVELHSTNRSALSCSAYLTFVGVPALNKAGRRALNAAYPKSHANGWGGLVVRISDHKAVSCRGSHQAAVFVGRAAEGIKETVAMVRFIKALKAQEIAQ